IIQRGLIRLLGVDQLTLGLQFLLAGALDFKSAEAIGIVKRLGALAQIDRCGQVDLPIANPLLGGQKIEIRASGIDDERAAEFLKIADTINECYFAADQRLEIDQAKAAQ